MSAQGGGAGREGVRGNGVEENRRREECGMLEGVGGRKGMTD